MKKLETIIETITQNIEMKFGAEKWVVQKKKTTKGKELPNQESITWLEEKEHYKYLEILEADIVKQT